MDTSIQVLYTNPIYHVSVDHQHKLCNQDTLKCKNSPKKENIFKKGVFHTGFEPWPQKLLSLI